MFTPATGGKAQAATGLAQSSDIPVADGFDFPVGKPDRTERFADGWSFWNGFENTRRHPYEPLYHAGEDWWIPGRNVAGEKVYTVADGIVEYSGDWNPGDAIIIKHLLPNGEVWYSMYGHLSNRKVSVGQLVTRGDTIAEIFNEWGNSHLHFEIRKFHSIAECGGNIPGPGYWPGCGAPSTERPTDKGWVDPSNFIERNRVLSPSPPPVCEELDSNNPPAETDGWQQWDTEETFNLNYCKPLLTGDTNGDGRTDLICPYDYPTPNTTQTWVKEATSDGFGPWTRWGALHASDTPPSDPYAGAFNIDNCASVLPANLDNDDQTDLLCVYDYGNNMTRTWAQLSSSSNVENRKWQFWGALHKSDSPANDPYAGAFNVKNCKPLLADDLDGDDQTDVLCVYDYGKNTTRTWAQLSSSSSVENRKWQFWGALHQANAAHNDPYAGEFNVNNCATIVTGHLDDDNQPDLACVYDYGNDTTRTWAQLSSDSDPNNRKWRFWGALHETTSQSEDPYAGAFNVKKCAALAAGDVDNDQQTDLICVYDYGNEITRTWVQRYADGEHGERKWHFWGPLHSAHTPEGTFNAQNCTLLEADDVDGDGDTDLVCSYDYGTICNAPKDTSRTWVQRSTGSTFEAWTPTGSPDGSGFRLGNCTPLTLGDVNNDAQTELLCPYDRGREQTDTWVQFLDLDSAPVVDGPVLRIEPPETGVAGEVFYVPVTLNHEGNVVGVQFAVRSGAFAVLDPACDADVRMGDLFPSDSLIHTDCSPGQGWDFILTLAPGETAEAGEGIVVELPFRGRSAGCTDLHFGEHVLNDEHGNRIEHKALGTDVCVNAATASVSGQGFLQARNTFASILVELLEGGRLVATTSTDEAGNFSFDHVMPGNYQVHFTYPLYFKAKRYIKVVAGKDTMMERAGLWVGDMDGNEWISKRDWRICAAASIPVDNPAFDANADGTTNVQDCTLVRNNIDRERMDSDNPPEGSTTSLADSGQATLESLASTPTQHIRTVEQANGAVLLRLEDFDNHIHTTGVRAWIAEGVIVDDVTLRGAFTGAFLHWHQHGNELYIIADVEESSPVTTDTDFVLIQTSGTAEDGEVAVTVQAVNLITETGATTKSLFLPMIRQ